MDKVIKLVEDRIAKCEKKANDYRRKAVEVQDNIELKVMYMSDATLMLAAKSELEGLLQDIRKEEVCE